VGDRELDLRPLGVDRLVLEIHDPSFPGDPDEDVGRGTPYSRGGRRFLRFVRSLGFDGIQLGPQGQLTRDNPSPYDSALGPRATVSAALAPLCSDGLLSDGTLRELTAGRPADDGRADHRYAWDATARALAEAHATFRRLQADLPDAGADAFAQTIVAEQHRALRAELPDLRLYGDLPIGMAPADAAALRALFLPDHWMGAPPSRTNPDGQPWGYPVFDPRARADTLRFLRARVRRFLADYDGIRIDHPHGLVCPWVYRPDEGVRAGGRLYSSPDRPDLAEFAIARPEQLDRTRPRHDDGWVRELDDAQVDRYAELFDAIMDEVAAAGRARDDVVCEILSTLPYPLARVLARHQLGRFRVAQKLALADPADVYRIERAEPADWVMIGNHDTPSVWELVDCWRAGPDWAGWGDYLAGLLAPAAERAALSARLQADAGEMVHALFAALLASRARHVSVFFTDLLGMTGRYNLPGTVSDANWSLRVPPDYERRYREALASGRALDLVRAATLARRARERARS
jgi:4-alpha-glucanotransferase